MNLDKKALAGFIKEVEDSRTRQKGETDLQRDVFKRAREKHFDVKALRIVLQRRAMETSKRDEQDYNVHAYELALGGKKDAMEALERGASTREAAKIGGISNGAAAALAKGAQKSSFVSAPHDPETGEVTEAALSGDDAGHRSEPSAPAEQSVIPRAVSGPVEAVHRHGEGEQSGTHSETAPGLPPSPAPESGVGAGTKPDLYQRITGSFKPLSERDAPENIVAMDPKPKPRSAADDDDLKIPDFLRRKA